MKDGSGSAAVDRDEQGDAATWRGSDRFDAISRAISHAGAQHLLESRGG
jgi:hypothetical protein